MLLDNERVYSTSDDVRRGLMSQENRHYLFYNIGESDDGDGRGGYRSKIRHSLSHDPGELGILKSKSTSSVINNYITPIVTISTTYI